MTFKPWESTFLNALHGTNEGRLPVWFMRQAGRYLPEYQELRKKHDFREMSHVPKLICETTVQPLRRFPLDAAILFSDILTCLEFMGAPFKFEEGGPTLTDAGPKALTGLRPLDPAKDMSFVGEGIHLIKESIGTRPLIGFVGAPFTLASYLIEGGSSREFLMTRKFMLESPEAFLRAMDVLATSVGNYLSYQIKSGVNAVQIFDSWGGFLSQDQYRTFIIPSLKKLIAIIKPSKTPIIFYSQPTLHLAPLFSELDLTAVSVDWRVTFDKLAPQTGRLAIQGNLDPVVTTLPWEQAKPHVHAVLESAARAKILNRYVFNVGHGVSPMTRIETLEKIVETVHDFKK